MFHFSFSQSCIHLAQGTRSVDTLDDHIQKLLNLKAKRRASSSSSPGVFHRTGSFIFTSSFTEKPPDDRHDSMSSADWVKVEDIITTMEGLAFHCKQGKRCCTCIITCYKVAQVRQFISGFFVFCAWAVDYHGILLCRIRASARADWGCELGRRTKIDCGKVFSIWQSNNSGVASIIEALFQ